MNRRSFFAGAAAAIATCGVATPIDALIVPRLIGWEQLPSSTPGVMLFQVTVEYDT